MSVLHTLQDIWRICEEKDNSIEYSKPPVSLSRGTYKSFQPKDYLQNKSLNRYITHRSKSRNNTSNTVEIKQNSEIKQKPELMISPQKRCRLNILKQNSAERCKIQHQKLLKGKKDLLCYTQKAIEKNTSEYKKSYSPIQSKYL